MSTRTSHKDRFNQAIPGDLQDKIQNVPCRMLRSSGRTVVTLQSDRVQINEIKLLFPVELDPGQENEVMLDPGKDVITQVTDSSGAVLAQNILITFVGPRPGRRGLVHHLEVKGQVYE